MEKLSTTQHAAISKLSAIAKNYYKDKYLPYLLGFSRESLRRQRFGYYPTMNRGTYYRVKFMDRLILRSIKFFVENLADEEFDSIHIVQLGAGNDTTFHRLYETFKRQPKKIKYLEIDVKSVVISKIKKMARKKRMFSFESIKNSADNVFNLVGEQFHAIAFCDLSDLDALKKTMESTFGENYKEVPTIFVSECVLVYLDVNDSNSILRWASTEFKHSSISIFEQLMGSDRYGEVMYESVLESGIELKSMKVYRDLDSQINRLKTFGFSNVKGKTMLNMVRDFLMTADEEELKEVHRVNKIEILDEFNEWQLLLSHYSFVWGSNTPGDFEL